MVKVKKLLKIKIIILICVLISAFFLTKRVHTQISLNEKKVLMFSKIQGVSQSDIVTVDEPTILFNTVFVPMDMSLSKLFENYSFNEDIQEFNDENYTFKIDKNNNIITVTNNLDDDTVDNTVVVEIEKINNNNYVPLYLLSNIPNILVKINGKDAYSASNYKTSIELFKNNNNKIEIFKLDENDENQKNIVYFGQQQGALWREEAYKRIEKYRKKNVEFNILNQNNDKIDYSKIDLKLINNEFNFGTSIRITDNKNSENLKYLFNTIGEENIFKWKFIENEGYNNINKLYALANNSKLKVRFHNLFWDINNVQSVNQAIVSKSDDNSKYLSMNEIKEKLSSQVISLDEAIKLSDNTIKKYEELVFSHIEHETKLNKNIDEFDVVNEPLAQQYFKHYLFDKNFLKDDNYLNNSKYWQSTMDNNEEYYKFLAKCFDIAKEESHESKLLLNDNLLTGKKQSNFDKETIKILNEISKYTSNVDIIGIQNHVNCNYQYSPQSYYNEINYLLNNNSASHYGEITEYDNYIQGKYNYSNTEANNKAQYLEDSLINAYSNVNLVGFNFWVFNSNHFTDEERKAYEETIAQWNNYECEEKIKNGKYDTNLTKGLYEANVTLANGKSQKVNFEISDKSENIINVVFNSKLKEIKIKNQPKINYYTDDKISKDGSIIACYDDGTEKEVPLADKNVVIYDFDTSLNGEKNVKIQYLGCETEYTIKVKEDVEKDTKTIIDKNKEFKEENSDKFIDDKIENINDSLLANLAEISNTNEDENNKDLILKSYDLQFDLSKNIISKTDSYDIYYTVISNYVNVTSLYKKIFENYSIEPNVEDDILEDSINKLIERYNNNLDIDLNKESEFINNIKDEYNSMNNEESDFEKNIILKKIELVNIILEKPIKKQADNEYRNIKKSTDKELDKLTNENIRVTIDLPNDKSIVTNNDNKNIVEFTENGEFLFEINIRGYDYDYKVSVNNIDKKTPVLIINNQNNVLSVNAEDENLKEMHIEKDGIEITSTKNITTPGIYNIYAIDQANNKSISKAIIFGTYKENADEKRYIPIEKIETKVKEIKENSNFVINENGKELNDDSLIKTGDILISGNQEYTLVVKGDLSNSGKVGIVDLIKLRKQLVSIDELSPLNKISADLNNDNAVNIIDLIELRKKIVGIE